MAEGNVADMTRHESNYGQFLQDIHVTQMPEYQSVMINFRRERRMNSPRVQKCLDRAEHFERATSILTSPDVIATFLRAARSWREMAEQYREREGRDGACSGR